MSPSQGTHKTQQRERAAVGGRRGLMEVPRSRNCQKRWRRKARGGSSEGWISKTAPDEPGDGIVASESGSSAHTRWRMRLSPPEKIGAWARVCRWVDWPRAPWNMRSPVGEELAGKSHRWRWRRGDQTEIQRVSAREESDRKETWSPEKKKGFPFWL